MTPHMASGPRGAAAPAQPARSVAPAQPARSPAPAQPARSPAFARSAAKDEEVTRLVQAAASGDRDAWDSLVSRYVALLWSIAFRHGLGESDAADVVQNTWLRLFEHIDGLREPARVGSWLATTAQREALRIVAQHRRMVPSDDEAAFDGAD